MRYYKVLLLFLLIIAGSAHAQSTKYKCMIQMTGYQGLKAYVVVSLVHEKEGYKKTLAVLGPDKQWYNTLTEWYAFHNKSKEKISAITGASIDRKSTRLNSSHVKIS